MHTIEIRSLIEKISITDKVVRNMCGDLTKFNEPFIGYDESDGLYITYSRKDIAMYIEFKHLNNLNCATVRWA